MKKMTEMITYERAVEYLLNVPKFTQKNTVEDTKKFLRVLGNPDQKLHIIHVAGTNGKGSVCSYMRYILEAAGYQTAVFTSPHLVDLRERFVIRGKMVSKEAFLQAFLHIYQALDHDAIESGTGYHPTFFEYLFFMAVLLFADSKLDYCIMETGLGGRLDATNAVSQKELSVITRIGIDHTAYLGDTVEQIAYEKAGIMQKGVPVIYINTQEAVSTVFEEQAKELGISAYSVSKKDYNFREFRNKSIDFSIQSLYYGYVELNIRTQARYQMENATLAVRAIEILDGGKTISQKDIVQGIHQCFWQGRMEEILPGVYVDGAHNEDGMRAFLESVNEDGCRGQRFLLFGVVQDKDYSHMMRRIMKTGLFDKVALTQLRTERAVPLERLQQLMEEERKKMTVVERQKPFEYSVHNCVDTALQELREDKKLEDYIYIVGSLYLVGEIKELVGNDQF